VSFVLGFISGALAVIGYGVWRLVSILRKAA